MLVVFASQTNVDIEVVEVDSDHINGVGGSLKKDTFEVKYVRFCGRDSNRSLADVTF